VAIVVVVTSGCSTRAGGPDLRAELVGILISRVVVAGALALFVSANLGGEPPQA